MIFFIFAIATANNAPAGYYPGAGYRDDGTGSVGYAIVFGIWWESGASGQNGWRWYVSSTAVVPSEPSYRGYGWSVRCLQAFTSDLVSRTARISIRHFCHPETQ